MKGALAGVSVIFVVISVMLAIIVAGCTAAIRQTAQDTAPQASQETSSPASPTPPSDSKKWQEVATVNIASEEQAEQTAAAAKQLAKNFYEFDQAAYENALKEGKYVFLDFYANWCPICKAESPGIKAAFNELGNENVIGFQVNYNDDQTDNNEKALAKKFGITYQHTKVVINSKGNVLSRSLKSASKQEILDQINDSVATAAK